MKRSIGGGTHRGPVGINRQRRTIRFVQALLVLISGGLMMLAGYSYGRVTGYEDGREAEGFDAPKKPSIAQTLVLVTLGGITIGAAGLLGGPGGVRIPTPARLDELSGRAEAEAIERAEKTAADKSPRG
jgi:hypothetical protein